MDAAARARATNEGRLCGGVWQAASRASIQEGRAFAESAGTAKGFGQVEPEREGYSDGAGHDRDEWTQTEITLPTCVASVDQAGRSQFRAQGEPDFVSDLQAAWHLRSQRG